LEPRVACALCVPDSQDFNAPVPVMVEDSSGAVLADEVNFSICASNEFAVVCQVAGVDLRQVDVFFQNQHVFYLEISSQSNVA